MGKTRKTITFDIDTKVGDELLGDYRIAHNQIQRFLEKRKGFLHPQGSVYESSTSMSYFQIERVIEDMLNQYPHLKDCIRDIRSTTIKKTHTLNHLLIDDEPLFIQESSTPINDEVNKKIWNSSTPTLLSNNESININVDKSRNTRKNIVFDIDTKIGDAVLGDYHKAHYQIQSFLEKQNHFLHPEGSVYESPTSMSYFEIERIIEDMLDKYPPLKDCIRDIRTNSIGKTHILNYLLQDNEPEQALNQDNSNNEFSESDYLQLIISEIVDAIEKDEKQQAQTESSTESMVPQDFDEELSL